MTLALVILGYCIGFAVTFVVTARNIRPSDDAPWDAFTFALFWPPVAFIAALAVIVSKAYKLARGEG